jgi:hypothetical protein
MFRFLCGETLPKNQDHLRNVVFLNPGIPSKVIRSDLGLGSLESMISKGRAASPLPEFATELLNDWFFIFSMQVAEH